MCLVLNGAGADLDTDYGLTSSLEMHSDGSGSNLADVSKPGATKPAVGDSPGFSYDQDVAETISPTPVHMDQSVSHGICDISPTTVRFLHYILNFLSLDWIGISNLLILLGRLWIDGASALL